MIYRLIKLNFRTMKATKDNYTHIVFYYEGKGKMTLNKSTFLHVYPNEKEKADRYEYLIKPTKTK